ncbi:Ig-like domain-containing protein, partial [bacterium]|nr:Ig-like domain-containing protein [bacterium]
PPQLVVVFGEGQANNPPVAVDDAANTLQGVSVEIDVTGNDSDSDGTLDPASIAIITPSGNGTAVADAGTGLVSYTPDPTFVGEDSFAYTVNDNLGATSNAATVFITVSEDTSMTMFAFQPIEDGQVKLTQSSKNYGDKKTAKVDEGEFNTYLKFNVTGVSGTVQSVKLRLFVTNPSSDGGSVYSVSNSFSGTATPWVEETLSASNAPEISGLPVGEIGVAPLDEFVEVTLAPIVSGEGIYSFGLSKNTSDRVEYQTKEGAQPPELIVEIGSQASKRSTKSSRSDAATRDAAPAPLPTKVTLGANYPNPFNAGTTITYSLPTTMKVELVIFNTRGQQVRRLVQGLQQPGHKRVEWDARDDRGKDVSSGVYFLHLKIGSQNLTRRMILQK